MTIAKQDIENMKMLATRCYERKVVANGRLARVKSMLIESQIAGHITLVDFYRITSLMSSQMRARLWEKYFIEKYGFLRVRVKENRGDMTKHGKYYEYKASGFNADGKLHLVQLRPWQNCDYIVQAISGDGAKTYHLTKARMMQEIAANKATPAHGTQSANAQNQNIEWRMSLSQNTVRDTWGKYLAADPAQIR